MPPGTATIQTQQSSRTIPPPWRTRFERNLRALALRQPEMAQSLARLCIPPHVEPADGRDGTPTFRLRDAEGRRYWFGRSSMPSISARALFGDKRYHGGQVALPGVLTGVEPLVIAEGLPRRCAVFVFEAEPLHVALALHLHDYADLIEAGRIVLICAGDMQGELVRLFQRYPGYEMPTFLLRAVQVSPTELSELQRQLELAGQAVIEHQNKLISIAVRSLRSRKPAPLPDRPSLAVIGLDVHSSVIADAGRVVAALDRLDWPHAVSVLDRPERCHVLSPIRAIQQGRDTARPPFADVVLCIGRGAGALRPLVPETLPVATWITDDRACDMQNVGPPGPHDVIFVSNADMHEKLRRSLTHDGRGSGDAVLLCEPAADDAVFHPLENRDRMQSESGMDVLLVGDLPDDRPEAADIKLTSHVALWNAARKTARRWADEDRPLDPERVLVEALRASGITLSEAPLRDAMMELICTRVVPAARGHSLMRAVESNRLSVCTCGSHWPDSQGKIVHRTEVIPPPPELNKLYNAASLVVFPGEGVVDVCRALDALSAGASVVLRGDAERFRRRFPRLSELVPSIRFFASLRDFHALLKRKERVPRPTNMEKHSVAARLTWMMDMVRGRVAKS